MNCCLSEEAQDRRSGSHWPVQPVLHCDEQTKNLVMRSVGHRPRRMIYDKLMAT
jgi:hypothetical protein